MGIPYADEAGTVARDDHASARVERIQHVAQPVKSKLDSDSHRSRTRMKFVTCNTVVLLGTRIRGPIGKFTRGALLFDEISTRKPQQGATSMTTPGRWRV